MNYSPPAIRSFDVILPWHANAAIMVPGSITVGGLALWALVARALYQRKRREAEKLREQMLEQERQALAEMEAKNAQLGRPEPLPTQPASRPTPPTRRRASFLRI